MPVRLPDDLLDQIDQRARALGRSRASVIRSLLLEALGSAPVSDEGVDRAQLRRSLARTPRERIEHMIQISLQQERLRGRARPAAR